MHSTSTVIFALAVVLTTYIARTNAQEVSRRGPNNKPPEDKPQKLSKWPTLRAGMEYNIFMTMPEAVTGMACAGIQCGTLTKGAGCFPEDCAAFVSEKKFISGKLRDQDLICAEAGKTKLKLGPSDKCIYKCPGGTAASCVPIAPFGVCVNQTVLGPPADDPALEDPPAGGMCVAAKKWTECRKLFPADDAYARPPFGNCEWDKNESPKCYERTPPTVPATARVVGSTWTARVTGRRLLEQSQQRVVISAVGRQNDPGNNIPTPVVPPVDGFPVGGPGNNQPTMPVLPFPPEKPPLQPPGSGSALILMKVGESCSSEGFQGPWAFCYKDAMLPETGPCLLDVRQCASTFAGPSCRPLFDVVM